MFPASRSEAPLRAAAFAGGRDLRDATATTADGLTLHGWHAVAPGGPAETSERGLVLYLHGNGGDRRWRLGEVDAFAAAGWDTLLFDYRGYGENPGGPSEIGLKKDGRAFWRAALAPGYEPERIVIAGTSLGGGGGGPAGGGVVRGRHAAGGAVAQEHVRLADERRRGPVPVAAGSGCCSGTGSSPPESRGG